MASTYNVKVQFAAWVAVSTLATVLVLAALHLKLQLDAQQAAARKRAELTARSLAKSVAGALEKRDHLALPGIVAQVVSDDDVYHTRIVDQEGEAVYRPWNDREPVGLLVVSVPVEREGTLLGMVEVGLAETDLRQVLRQTVLADLVIGLGPGSGAAGATDG